MNAGLCFIHIVDDFVEKRKMIRNLRWLDLRVGKDG